MTNLVSKQRDFWLWLILIAGILLRFVPALQSDFPLNDGGMFLSMMQDLSENHFSLPVFISYNLSGIPFAYPPFGFYFAAALSSLFGFSEIDLLRWLPALASAGIVPVFYWLSVLILQDKKKALVAVMFIAFLPGSFDWLVMGGGLTRSFGILFFLLAVGFSLKLFREADARLLLVTILFCSLAVLSHPEVGLQTAGICFLVWAIHGRSWLGFRKAFTVALGTLALTSPWWMTVIAHHGFSPFASAMQTGIRERLAASLFHSFFSTQAGLPILPVLTLLGLIVTVRQRNYFFAGWAFLPFLLDPRNAPAVAVFGFVFLASDGLLFLGDELAKAVEKSGKHAPNISIWAKSGVFILLVLFLFWASFTSAKAFGRVRLQPADRDVMRWIQKNTPAGARFLLLTNSGQISPMVDAYQEWFPMLTDRHSQNTLQGLEWKLGANFYGHSLSLMQLQTCEDIKCVQVWARENQIELDHLLVRSKRIRPELLASIRLESSCRVIYETDETLICEYK